MAGALGAGPGLALPSQISISSTATLISAARSTRGALTIANLNTATLYLGIDNTVTTTTGFQIPANTAFTLDYRGNVYGIVAGATITISTWESYDT